MSEERDDRQDVEGVDVTKRYYDTSALFLARGVDVLGHTHSHRHRHTKTVVTDGRIEDDIREQVGCEEQRRMSREEAEPVD